MKLKTLKDFGENHELDYNRPILFKDTFVYDGLKAEAVKWVKFHEREIKVHGEEGFDDLASKAIIPFIKHFFNLTDDEVEE